MKSAVSAANAIVNPRLYSQVLTRRISLPLNQVSLSISPTLLHSAPHWLSGEGGAGVACVALSNRDFHPTRHAPTMYNTGDFKLWLNCVQ